MKVEYSKEAKQLFKTVEFKFDDYVAEKLIKDIKTDAFNIKKLKYIKMLTGDEAHNLGFGLFKVAKYFDINRKLFVIIIYSTGTNLIFVKYYKEKECKTLHREDGPADLVINKYNNNIIYYRWVKDGLEHRGDNLPQKVRFATIYNNQNNTHYLTPQSIAYVKDGSYHRENGPSDIRYFYPTGKQCGFICGLKWYKNGELHNDNDLPSDICFSLNYKSNFVTVNTKTYYRYNKLHRFTGPAWVCKNWKEETKFKRWYVSGKRIDRRKFPYMEDGKLKGNMLKHKGLALKTSLFDREYGQFIRKVIDNV